MIIRDKESVIFAVKAHDYDTLRIENMSLLKDLKHAAYLLGIPYSGRKKSVLAHEIVNHIKREME
jgi:hypothetical protein